jgi:hypothetical protein
VNYFIILEHEYDIISYHRSSWQVFQAKLQLLGKGKDKLTLFIGIFVIGFLFSMIGVCLIYCCCFGDYSQDEEGREVDAAISHSATSLHTKPIKKKK